MEEVEAIIDYDRYREEFIRWIKEEKRLSEADRYISHLDKTIAGKKINDPNELAKLFEDKSKHYRVAVRDFLKFLIQKGHRRYSQIVDFQAVIKIPSSGIRPSSEKFTDTESIIKAYEVVDDLRKLVIRLLVYSGQRLIEIVDMLNNFDERELIILEDKGIARYDLLAMYKRIGSNKANAEQTKRAWVAYMPADFAKQLRRVQVSYDSLKGKNLALGIIYPNQLRSWFTDFMDEHGVPEDVIEFMTGKTPETVLRKHYKGLEKKADRYYAKIVDKFPL
jgi:intergrase/recombinase